MIRFVQIALIFRHKCISKSQGGGIDKTSHHLQEALLRACHQTLLSILSEFDRVNLLLFSLKSSENIEEFVDDR